MGMISLAANSGPFFMRVNPNAAVFTPHFNKICDWNFGRFYPHQYLLVSFSARGCAFAWAICDGNEEGLASFGVRDSNTAQLAAAHS